MKTGQRSGLLRSLPLDHRLRRRRAAQFNWVCEPGKLKKGPRPGRVSPHHDTVENAFLRSGDFCGTCHNEKSPYGTWVKATHLEWKEGPQGKGGIQCQNCHMPPAAGVSAKMGEPLPDVRQHLFHGAHDDGKLLGVIEVRVHPEAREAEPGDRMKFTAVVVNAKAGHKVPTGSAEERLLWLDVEAKDATSSAAPTRSPSSSAPVPTATPPRWSPATRSATWPSSSSTRSPERNSKPSSSRARTICCWERRCWHWATRSVWAARSAAASSAPRAASCPRRANSISPGSSTIAAQDLAELMKVDAAAWKAEVPDIEKHFKQFGDRLPERLQSQLKALKERMG